jgi:hypothetical protein
MTIGRRTRTSPIAARASSAAKNAMPCSSSWNREVRNEA